MAPKKARSSKRKTEETESKSSKKIKKEEKSEQVNDDNIAESNNFTSDAKSLTGKKWNLKISSWNVNGIRSWLDKGIAFLKEENPDILCLQETKCGDNEIPKKIKDFEGYHKYWLSGDQKGYSGVGLLTKKKPLDVTYGIGNKEHDKEGRVITAEYEEFYIVNAYVPNAGRGLVRLDYRMKWDNDFLQYLKELDSKKPLILCGDLNVAHNEIDLARPKSNKKNAGFTKEEREDFTKLLSEGFFDSFRKLYPDTEGCYTFWSYMMNARGKDIGWRLDYFVLSEQLEQNLCDNLIRKKILGSDHCPITLLMSF
ncbi:exodeoxyribonuclease-like [Centruroides vittatus]|uniref:exodeoxyribonuclease-like n=1 Tax=Centruroides vittatus TaxID=120091 RepID=UPI00350EF8E3